MLYEYREPGNTPQTAAFSLPGPIDGPFIQLQNIGHYNAVSTYLVKRDDLPELLVAYTLGGRGRLVYRGIEHRLERGSAFLIDCRELHTYETAGDHWDFLWMHIRGELADAFAAQIWAQRGVVTEGGMEFAVQWQTVMELARKGDSRYLPQISSAIYQLLSLFLLPRQRDDRIEKAIAYIQEHADQPVPIETLARVACMSPYYFQRRFKEETGLTAHAFLSGQRVSRAKHLLLTTSLPIAKIAELTGFSNSSHFTGVFKSRTGCTPKEYRRRVP